MITKKELGRRIAIARKAAFLSRKQLAKELRISYHAVFCVETGKRKVDSLELYELSVLVNLNIQDFFAEHFTINKQYQ